MNDRDRNRICYRCGRSISRHVFHLHEPACMESAAKSAAAKLANLPRTQYDRALHRRRIYEGQRVRAYLKRMAQVRYERWAKFVVLED